MKPSARIVAQLTGNGGKPVVSLPTLGGTAVELVEPMPPVPRGAWAIMGIGLAVLAWAAWRGRERSVPATRAPGGFRSHPAEDVMLVEVA